MPDQFVRGDTISRKQTDADRARHRHFVSIDQHRGAEQVEQLAGNPRGIFLPACSGQQNDEFVSTLARHQVGMSHRTGQPVGDLAQQLVARMVTEGIVHGLEVVQIEEQHCQCMTGMTLPTISTGMCCPLLCTRATS
jgi:hypothetical protein